MTFFKENFKLLLIFLILVSFRGTKAAVFAIYYIERTGNCPDTPEDVPINFGNVSCIFGKTGLQFMGDVPVKESVKNDIDLRIAAERCDMNGANCVLYSNQTFTNICDTISKNLLFGDTFAKITNPPFMCPPLKAKIYALQDMPVDLSALNLWPIEGYRWKAMFYFMEGGGGKDRRALGCFTGEATVTVSRIRGSKGRG